MKEEPEAVRLDKWLWAARFFKTRSGATAAIGGGHVHVNGERVKPARKIRPGDRLEIRRDTVRFVVDVHGLKERRGPVGEARALYRELPESIERREQEAAQRRESAARRARGLGRPTKKDRRDINRLRQEDPQS